jgi:hypothetical protein
MATTAAAPPLLLRSPTAELLLAPLAARQLPR